ncbi:MAG TPA: UDP-N-acetylmuramate dehydrogenase [Alphaproteobacteria bacterium]|nr:UDP-N-acetylmuramate dehydrogenase [Alphaproteobacteria bacterium]USO04809.1 MAG: UDP-N-acetylmuramate dehydrogenase [Rhodospirillales bacterium]HOO80873.1 UDP-N-acetylmuramate dehydrogenase [Alphaproteobacteria bacterium]
MKGIRGTLTENAPLGAQSWFRCGGHADLLFQPADADDLAVFLKVWPLTPKKSPPGEGRGSTKTPLPLSGGGLGWGGKSAWGGNLTIIGGMANTIVRDGGIRGATIQLGKPFAEVKVLDGRYIQAGCGALNGNVAAAAVKAGIGGLEFLSGIPGTLGGALRMNAGAYGSEIKDVLIGVNAITRAGHEIRIVLEDLKMSYRHTELPEEMIFTSAILKGVAEDYETVKARITEIKKKRNDTQPIKEKTGGSTFANPPPAELRKAGLPEDTRAWQVVEKVGARGLRVGGAQMSKKHCNFMINTGDATARDLEMLGEEIRKRAKHDLGLTLHWEIQRVGEV